VAETLEQRGARYYRERKIASMAAVAIAYLFIGIWIMTDLPEILADTALAASSKALRGVIYLSIPVAFAILVIFALQILSYVVERRFQLSNLTTTNWLRTALKRLAFLAFVLVAFALLMVVLVTYLPEFWVIAFWAVLAGYRLATTYFFTPLLLHRFYQSIPLEDESRIHAFRTLEARAGVKIHEYRILHLAAETNKANALAQGFLGKNTIFITDTLLASHSPVEVEAIIAHELGHIKHHDVARRLAFFTGTEALSFALLWLACSAVDVGEFTNLPILGLGILAAVFLPRMFALRLWRGQERKADELAFTIADATAFVSAMRKIREQNLLTYDRKAASKFTHPAIEERIEEAERWLKAHETVMVAKPQNI
jgi:STE24 endopeptidase